MLDFDWLITSVPGLDIGLKFIAGCYDFCWQQYTLLHHVTSDPIIQKNMQIIMYLRGQKFTIDIHVLVTGFEPLCDSSYCNTNGTDGCWNIFNHKIILITQFLLCGTTFIDTNLHFQDLYRRPFLNFVSHLIID